MLENRPIAVAKPLPVRPARRQQARVTNNPLTRADGNSPQGRRIRDLYRAYMAALGNPADTIVQANALAAAELKTAAEDARAKLLAGIDIDPGMVARFEGIALRAERKLGIKAGTAKPVGSPIPSTAELVAGVHRR